MSRGLVKPKLYWFYTVESRRISLKGFTVKDFKQEELRCPTDQQMPSFNW